MPASQTTKYPSLFQKWVRAVRAPSLIAAILPVLLGGGLALLDRGFDGWTFLLTMIAVMLIQAGSNLLNEYYDDLKGADAHGVSVGVLHKGWLLPHQLYAGAWVCYILALLLGGYLVSVGGWVVLVLGIVGVLGSILYSATRLALSYHALGEVTMFLLSGPLVTLGTYYAMVKIAYAYVLLSGVPYGLLAMAVTHVHNLRDIRHDRMIGKRTLASTLPQRPANRLFYLLLLFAYVIPLLLWVMDVMPALSLLPLLTIPLAIRIIRTVRPTTEPVELNMAFGLTALLELLFGILQVFGLFLYYFTHL
ncbi:1,4-dihydroxy-2-naphthoate octaprenyltransferase [Tumebacillus permanentifrigoris]|uniref:1,4-dihydroxy-2-naphthoate octaprenyltransferase n=1 Tax=Tumebacillus permanentifrigoris TaxID=378543 RepID=A0A316D8L0_9BACL|nr:1,4-dihydroxy-2-naphthoate octaprenyltransferase [Tumebacillus permanentifrigoris]PWK10268.1 1,4-dihydroxy-2-naphthoate prenyltransferase [Tumebacillus permanentifrigoris]